MESAEPVNAELLAALELILPMAKGYAAVNQVGSNKAFCEIAEAAILKAEQQMKGEGK